MTETPTLPKGTSVAISFYLNSNDRHITQPQLFKKRMLWNSQLNFPKDIIGEETLDLKYYLTCTTGVGLSKREQIVATGLHCIAVEGAE